MKNGLKGKGKSVVLGVFSLLLLVLLSTEDLCLFKRVTGFPCLGCGMTRAFLAFFRADMHQAFFYHPLFWTIPLLFSAYFLRNRVPYFRKNSFWIGVGLFFLAVYVVRMFCYFPNTPPLDFSEKAWLPKIFHFFMGK